MDHTVNLPRLPEGLVFPAEMSDKFRYDSDRHQLSFRGFMCKAEFDRLSRLHEDWGYRRALEDLFRLCTLEPDGPTRPTNRLSAVFARLLARRA